MLRWVMFAYTKLHVKAYLVGLQCVGSKHTWQCRWRTWHSANFPGRSSDCIPLPLTTHQPNAIILHPKEDPHNRIFNSCDLVLCDIFITSLKRPYMGYNLLIHGDFFNSLEWFCTPRDMTCSGATDTTRKKI